MGLGAIVGSAICCTLNCSTSASTAFAATEIQLWETAQYLLLPGMRRDQDYLQLLPRVPLGEF